MNKRSTPIPAVGRCYLVARDNLGDFAPGSRRGAPNGFSILNRGGIGFLGPWHKSPRLPRMLTLRVYLAVG